MNNEHTLEAVLEIEILYRNNPNWSYLYVPFATDERIYDSEHAKKLINERRDELISIIKNAMVRREPFVTIKPTNTLNNPSISVISINDIVEFSITITEINGVYQQIAYDRSDED